MTLYSGILARIEALAPNPDTGVLDDIDRTLEGVFQAQPANGGPVRACTRSLDAALALCERVLPGAMWSASPGYPEGVRRGQTLGVHVNRPIGAHWATHDVPALALLCAMLKALIAQAAGPEGGS